MTSREGFMFSRETFCSLARDKHDPPHFTKLAAAAAAAKSDRPPMLLCPTVSLVRLGLDDEEVMAACEARFACDAEWSVFGMVDCRRGPRFIGRGFLPVPNWRFQTRGRLWQWSGTTRSRHRVDSFDWRVDS